MESATTHIIMPETTVFTAAFFACNNFLITRLIIIHNMQFVKAFLKISITL